MSTITREPVTHNLKIWPEYFAAVREGLKRAELRWNDREYQAGDILDLCEWDPNEEAFTGDFISVTVTHVADLGQWMPGYVLLSVAPPAPVDNTFIPKNLDRALGVVGVALPESKEEFNFQIERWIQRLIDRVIRYSDEFKEQPEPVLPKATPSLKAMMQALDAFYAEEEVPERGMLSAFRILLDDTCRAAMLNQEKSNG